jgi:hypothetical protein
MLSIKKSIYLQGVSKVTLHLALHTFVIFEKYFSLFIIYKSLSTAAAGVGEGWEGTPLLFDNSVSDFRRKYD